jgi:hypothetical protein
MTILPDLSDLIIEQVDVTTVVTIQEALREMGFELGGEAGARLGKKLSYKASPDTMLRLVKRAELPATSSPRVVGLDDWSWKRHLRYGTLICDLESHTPIEVLPDRSVACKQDQNRRPKRRNHPWRKKDVLLALSERKRLAWLDVLKSWIDTSKPTWP